MQRYLWIGLVAFGFSGGAIAQNGVASILENLQSTVENLSVDAGLEDALATGSGQTEVLPLPQDTLPFPLGSLDDELEARIDTLENAPEDLEIIVANLGHVPEAAIEGRPFTDHEEAPIAAKTGLRDAAIELLEGNLVEPPAPPFSPDFRPSAINSGLLGLASAADALVAGTSHDRDYNSGIFGSFTNVGGLDLSNTIIFGMFSLYGPARQFEPVEEDLAPLFEGAEPLTLPLIDAIEGLEL